jgi:hypothetical protein
LPDFDPTVRFRTRRSTDTPWVYGHDSCVQSEFPAAGRWSRIEKKEAC